MKRAAKISDCGLYRWTLTRRWDDRSALLAVMFNPSDADHERDDPTITLLCHIASHNGFGGLVVVNLCPLRTSKPAAAIAMLQRAQCTPDADYDARKVLWENVNVLCAELDQAGAVLLAWGAMGGHAGDWFRTVMGDVRARASGKPVYRLGVCANGHPKHPMARGKHKVPKDAPLMPWREPA